MNQKLDDLKLLLKNDRRVWAAAGFIVVALFIWVLTNQGGGRRAPAHMPIESTASKQGTGADEGFADLIVAFKNDIEAGKKDRIEMNDVLQRTKKDLNDYKERSTGIFETLVDKFEQISREVDALAAAVKSTNEDTPLPPPKELEGEDSLEQIFPEEPTVAPPPPEPQPVRVSVIAPGDSVTVTLLTGVNAPVDGTPYPVVFKLTGPISGPDGSSLDLGEARLIAAAQGSESDERALFRLTQLSIRHPNGRRAVVDVDGWVVGEDGIRGMSGKLIDKLGRLIVTTAIVSGVAALGERMDQNTGQVSYQRNSAGSYTVQPEDFNYAAASAVTDASNRLGQILLSRYESLVPVVEVLGSREVAAIFSKPAEIEILEEGPMLASFGGFE
jgi:hypothetical protein